MVRQKQSKSTNFSRVGWRVILALLAFACALSTHFFNRSALLSDHPEALRNGITVRTADDASYLRPALNFLETGTWKDNSAGVRAYVQRSPGYGLLYATATSVFGEANALWVMFFSQLLLWSLAVALIPSVARNIGLDGKVSMFLGFFVAVMPMFSGFLSYTLTEAVTPSLVILFYFFFFEGIKKNRRALIVSALFLGFTILVRPALIVLFLSFLPFLIGLKSRLIPLTVIALLPIFLWQLRVQRFTDRFDLHPIYHSDSNDLYRPLHGDIWNFHKMTGQSGVDFHRSMEQLWRAAEKGKNEQEAVDAVMNDLDPSVFQVVEKERLRELYGRYIDVLSAQIPYIKTDRPIVVELENEDDLEREFRQLRSKYQSSYVLQSWVLVPMEVFKDLIFHSNLSLYIFQGPWRGAIPVEILRWLSFLVHIFSFTLFLVLPFWVRKNPVALSIWFPAVFYLAYLIFIQRGVEERYTLPFLVPAFLLSALVLNTILSFFLTLNSQTKARKVST
jgi:hypothetical protein